MANNLTNFPNGVSSFGIPLVGGGSLTIPTGGTSYFVDPARGNDTNDGKSPATALDTLAAAYALCTSGQNDVIYLIGDGSTTGTARQTATLTWAKNATHLIGWGAPSYVSQRARIAPASTATQFTPFMTISGSGCIFANVSWFYGFTTGVDTANVCLNVTGSRNFFGNCHIAGMGTDLAGDNAGGYSLVLTGAQENVFNHCAIGLDTAVRSAANAEIKFASQAARNTFEQCLILSFCDAATHVFVDASTSLCMDRWQLFKNCLFVNPTDSTSTTMTVGMNTHASMGGTIIMDNSIMIGATDVADDFTQVKGLGPSANGTYAQGIGLAVSLA